MTFLVCWNSFFNMCMFSIPPIETDDNSLIFSDLEKSNFFNETFQIFFTVDNNSQFSFSPPEHNKYALFNYSSQRYFARLQENEEKTVENTWGHPVYLYCELARRLFLPVCSIARLNLIVFNFLNCLSIIQRRYIRARTVLFELKKS